MAETYEEIESRTMSGTGVLRIPKDTEYRDFLVYVQVIREPKNKYANLEWEPPKGLYSRIVQRIDGYVQNNYLQEFKTQIWRITPDISGQNLIATKCAYKGTLISFAEITTCLDGCVLIGVTDKTTPMSPLTTRTTDMIFSMYADTAIKVVLKGLKYDFCGDDDEKPRDPPEPPPDEPETPPGTPIDNLSPPYDDDDKLTQPNSLDEEDVPPEEDFPQGEQCVRYMINITVKYKDSPPNTTELPFYGIIEDVQVRNDNNCFGVYALAYGYANNTNAPCLESPEWLNIFCITDSEGDLESWSLNSITQI